MSGALHFVNKPAPPPPLVSISSTTALSLTLSVWLGAADFVADTLPCAVGASILRRSPPCSLTFLFLDRRRYWKYLLGRDIVPSTNQSS